MGGNVGKRRSVEGGHIIDILNPNWFWLVGVVLLRIGASDARTKFHIQGVKIRDKVVLGLTDRDGAMVQQSVHGAVFKHDALDPGHGLLCNDDLGTKGCRGRCSLKATHVCCRDLLYRHSKIVR